MDLTRKTVAPFGGELVRRGETLESVFSEIEETLEEPAQLVEMPLDKYIVDYLLEQAKGYEADSLFYNFSLTMNESIYLQLQTETGIANQADADSMAETKDFLEKLEEEGDKRYNIYRQEQREKGSMEAEYVQLKVALAKNLYSLLEKYAESKGWDVEEAIHECMYDSIYLDKVYSLYDIEYDLGIKHPLR